MSRRRVPTSAIVLAVVGVVLLCAGGATTATILLLRRPATEVAAGHHTTLSTPNRIGSMVRSTDGSGIQEVRDEAMANGATQVVVTRYEDETDPAYRISVSGQVYAGWVTDDLAARLDEHLAAAAETLGGRLAGTRSDVRASVGGRAACDEVPPYTACAWLNSDADMIIAFVGYDPALARLRFVELLAAIVHP